jgi:hypothetical protein
MEALAVVSGEALAVDSPAVSDGVGIVLSMQPAFHPQRIRSILMDSIDLTPAQRLTLLGLIVHADWSEDVAWVTKGALAKVLGCPERTIHKHVALLRKAGFVGEAVKRKDAGGWTRFGFKLLSPVKSTGVPLIDSNAQRLEEQQGGVEPAWKHDYEAAYRERGILLASEGAFDDAPDGS